MKRKLLCLLTIGLSCIGLAACGKEEEANVDDVRYALVANNLTEENTFITGKALEGLTQFATENSVQYAQYNQEGTEEDQFEDAIEEAVNQGAGIIVCVGEEMSYPVYRAQREYKEVDFVLLEAEPHKKNSDTPRYRGNSCSIFFKEADKGFLTGYAVVADGLRNLGFMGAQETDIDEDLAAGFVQGAEAAAQDLGLEAGAVQVRIGYLGNDNLSPKHMGTAINWYKDGCEVIFAPDKNIYTNVTLAAENQTKRVVGVDQMEAPASANAFITAIKDYAGAVHHVLEAYSKDEFEGNGIQEYGAKEHSISLNTGVWNYSAFSQTQYEAMYTKIEDGTWTITDEMITPALVTVTEGVIDDTTTDEDAS